MRVILAPHHFGTLLTPDVAARALALGWRNARPQDDVIIHPHSDGSTGFLEVVPGTMEVFTAEFQGRSRPVAVVRAGPDESPWRQTYCHTDVFASGEERRVEDFLTNSSGPMGEVVGQLLHKGSTRIVVGAGHTPWHDAGAGFLLQLARSLGLAGEEPLLRDEQGAIDPALAELLGTVREELKHVSIVVASTREVPLRGLHGAGAELSQIPNLTAEDAQNIEALTTGFVNAVDANVKEHASKSLLGDEEALLSRRSYAGAGGGVAFVLAALGAQVFPGAWVTGEETGLNGSLDGADLVVTGAGVVAGDELGEGVIADVASRASALAVPVIVVGGQVDASRRQLFKVGIHASYPVIDTPAGRPQITAPEVTETALVARGERLARTWSR